MSHYFIIFFKTRDLKMERELLRSAKWNARNGHLLFHEGNRARLRDMVTFHLPGMAEAPHGKKGGGHPQEQQRNCVRVGFVQCLTEEEGEQVKRRGRNCP